MKRKVEKLPTNKIEMSNGIILLVREDHSMPTISMAAYFLGGRRIETPEISGISTLSQRLLLKGAGDFNAQELAEELEYHGISISPFWGMDTVGVKMKTLSRHFDRGLSLFKTIITQPLFPPGELEKERENLIEDIHKEKDHLLTYTMDQCKQLVFEGHPYGLPPLGSKETISNLTREQILDFHHRCYCPSRMIVALVGDIKADEARKKLERHFASFQACSTLPEPGKIKGPIRNVKERVETTDKQQVAICVGFHAPEIKSSDYFAFQVLNQVLSGMGARLFIELRDKLGLAYTVSSRYSKYLSGGIFRAYILTGYHQKEKSRLALLEEVDRLRTRLVTYDELVRAKNYHLGLFDIRLQSNIAIASSLAYYELVGLGYKFIEEYSEKIKRITRQKVKRVAEKYLKPQSYAIVLLIPATFPKSLQ